MLTAVYILLLIKYAFAENQSPGCNYAATAGHFYPIGACDKLKTVGDIDTTYYAFRFICEGEDVYKYEYDTDEYCDGEPTSSAVYTDNLDSFECDLSVCTYSNGCSYTGCYNNETDSCQECYDNKLDYDRHCFPVITNHCHGNIGSILKLDTCSNGVFTENLYFGDNCTDTYLIDTIDSGGEVEANNCFDDAYYEADCVARLLPQCNYAATGTHYYPINACDRTEKTTESGIEYFSFDYVCNGKDVYRNEYDGSDFCKGTPTSTTKVNALLEHYECDLSACKYADSCALTLNECNSNSCDYDQHCLPTIVNNCIGNENELLFLATCDENGLTENFYFGDSCETALFSENFNGDETDCGKDTFSKVQCVDPADSTPITYNMDTECTKSPTYAPTTNEPTTNKPTSNEPTYAPTSKTSSPTTEEAAGGGVNQLSFFMSILFVISIILIN